MQKYHDEPKQYKGYLKSALSSERYEHDGERIRGRRTTRHNGRKSLLRRSRSGLDWFDDIQASEPGRLCDEDDSPGRGSFRVYNGSIWGGQNGNPG